MKVGELIKELSKYDENLDVMTKKNELFGNCGQAFYTYQGGYWFFGTYVHCVMISDGEITEREQMEKDLEMKKIENT